MKSKSVKQVIMIPLLLILLLIMSISAYAYEIIEFTADEVVTSIGETITVPISVIANSGFVSASIEVTYDNEVLTLIDVIDTGLIEGAYHTTDYSAPYYLTWRDDNKSSNYTETGVMANLLFEVSESAEPGKYSLCLNVDEDGVLDNTGSSIDVVTTDSIIEIVSQDCSHEWGKWNKSSSTKHKHICEICGDPEYERHDWDTGDITEEATETSEGIMTYTCDVCSGTKTSIIPALAHTHKWNDEYSKDETYHWYECSGCDEQNEKAEHVWDDGVETVFATETDVGIMTYTCRSCGHTKNEEIPTLEPKEYEITGTVIAYGDTEEAVTVIIYDAEGSPIASDSTTEGTYSFSVPDGIYILEVGKLSHVTREYEITVSGANVTRDVKLCLYGDVNDDGSVTNKDRLLLSRYLAKWDGYDLSMIDNAVADVNCDGVITNKDRLVLARYLAKWDGYDILPMP